jgi:NOL1/NOP2/fmu family ribosome biogenesis protein
VRAQVNESPLLHLLADGLPKGEQKGKDVIPTPAQALSLHLKPGEFPRVELPLEQAQRYLHREALVLPPATPRGFVIVTYKNYPLGFMKNLGERANNLYPKNWAIKKL